MTFISRWTVGQFVLFTSAAFICFTFAVRAVNLSPTQTPTPAPRDVNANLAAIRAKQAPPPSDPVASYLAKYGKTPTPVPYQPPIMPRAFLWAVVILWFGVAWIWFGRKRSA